MEHLSLHKDGSLSFDYEDIEMICTPVSDDQSIFHFLADPVRLERTYTIRDLINTFNLYPDLTRVHNSIEMVQDRVSGACRTLINRHDVNYLSFENIHETWYDESHNMKRTESYCSIDINHGDDLYSSIFDFNLEDIIDVPIIIRHGRETSGHIERIFIDRVSFLTFVYEIIDHLSILIEKE